MITREDVLAAEKIYADLCLIDTFDLPADHATYQRKVAAHIHLLRIQAERIGTPGSAEHIIGYLYGKGMMQTPIVVPPLNEQAPFWHERMGAREAHWAARAAIQFGFRTEVK
jgi:hypothetical protein